MDEQAWYYLQNDQQYGPIGESALAQKFGAGELDPETPVWCDTLTEWMSGSKVPQFRDAPRPAAPVASGPRLKPRTPPPQPAIQANEPEASSGEDAWKPKRVGLKVEEAAPPPPEETGLKKWFKRKPKVWRKDTWKPTGGFRRMAQLIAGLIVVVGVFGGGGYAGWYFFCWEDFTVKGEKFKLRMPRKQEQTNWSFPSPYGEIYVVQWESRSPVNGTRYAIAYGTAPSQAKDFNDRNVLFAAQQGLITHIGGEPNDNITHYPFLTFPAIDFSAYTTKGVTDTTGHIKVGARADGVKGKAFYVAAQSRVYILWANGPYGPLGPVETDAFIETFQPDGVP